MNALRSALIFLFFGVAGLVGANRLERWQASRWLDARLAELLGEGNHR